MATDPSFVKAVEDLIRELRLLRDEMPEQFKPSYRDLLVRLEGALLSYRETVAARDRTERAVPDDDPQT